MLFYTIGTSYFTSEQLWSCEENTLIKVHWQRCMTEGPVAENNMCWAKDDLFLAGCTAKAWVEPANTGFLSNGLLNSAQAWIFRKVF